MVIIFVFIILGLNEFTNYLRKEYSHENIRFWQAVLDLRYGPATEVIEKVNSIYELVSRSQDNPTNRIFKVWGEYNIVKSLVSVTVFLVNYKTS